MEECNVTVSPAPEGMELAKWHNLVRLNLEVSKACCREAKMTMFQGDPLAEADAIRKARRAFGCFQQALTRRKNGVDTDQLHRAIDFLMAQLQLAGFYQDTEILESIITVWDDIRALLDTKFGS